MESSPFQDSWKSKALLSIVALAAACFHMLCKEFIPDGITAGLLLVALLPWLSHVIRAFEIPGVGKFEFQAVKRKQDILQADVDALRFLVNVFVTDWELTHLTKLNRPAPFEYEWNGNDDEGFIHELTRLRDLGLIDRTIEAFTLIPRKDNDLKKFVYITDHGKKYLAIRELLDQRQSHAGRL